MAVRALHQDAGDRTVGSVRRVVLVPSAPLALREASPGAAAEHRDAVAALRAARTSALATLDPGLPCIVLAVGRPPGVHDHATVDLRPLGVPAAPTSRQVPRELLAPVTEGLQRPLLVGAPLGIDVTVLVASTDPATPVVPVELPSGVEGEPLLALGVGLAAAVERSGATVQLLVAADLSTGLSTASPRPELPHARATQRRVVEALVADDRAALAGIGPDAAASAGVRSWAVLTVASGVAAATGLRAHGLHPHEVRGVGHLVGVLA